MKRKIFISYARADKLRASDLYSVLKDGGYDVWWDQNIPGGARYQSEIEAALKTADLIIILWSENANDSDWVKDEADYARKNGNMFPLSLDGVLPPMGFRQFQVNPSPDVSDPVQVKSFLENTALKIANKPANNVETAQITSSPEVSRRGVFAPILGLMALVAVIAGVAVVKLVLPAGPNVEPLVIVMDSAHPSRVYDKEIMDKGGTNADILSDILSDLPIRTQKELISPLWDRDEAILGFGPDLILVHWSGFKQVDSSGGRPRLKLLIEYFADTDTVFLVYSRASDEYLSTNMDLLLSDFPQQADLAKRIRIFPILEYGEPHWKDPATSQAIKLKVKEILALD